ncbi:patatin-like phospholipase domain-containing protein 4 [Perognathus longimembris pacificus]|uniref:patatin-like phospholipase domain-containing protein 4 n=1 Tax=Perognathus longimembris pacificus TaxID=214514 RepID=UPI00201A115D|nr:patatin-like phospholipase domain-containing protein 4 [Perognathus longimembris pacificus]
MRAPVTTRSPLPLSGWTPCSPAAGFEPGSSAVGNPVLRDLEMNCGPLHLSMAACGFLGVWHLGVAQALSTHSPRLLRALRGYAGASAGALAAALLLTAPHRIQAGADFAFALAEETRAQVLGAATPGYDFLGRLRRGIESLFPPDAHLQAEHRLLVSLTHARSRANYRVSTFASREDLVQVLLASCFVPVYAGLKPVRHQGQPWVDGVFSDGLPVFPSGRTLTASPFCGRTDIGPQDGGRRVPPVNIARQEVELSMANLVRLRFALFPPARGSMEALYQAGFQDALRFLRKEDWLE